MTTIGWNKINLPTIGHGTAQWGPPPAWVAGKVGWGLCCYQLAWLTCREGEQVQGNSYQAGLSTMLWRRTKMRQLVPSWPRQHAMKAKRARQLAPSLWWLATLIIYLFPAGWVNMPRRLIWARQIVPNRPGKHAMKANRDETIHTQLAWST